MHKVIVVNDRTYHFGQVSGIEQLGLYEEIGARLLANCANALKDEIDVNLLKGLLLGAPKGTIKHLSDVMLPHCVEQGAEKAVNIADYQGNIDHFVLLVCHALMVNLSDFFTSIENQVTELIAAVRSKEKSLL